MKTVKETIDDILPRLHQLRAGTSLTFARHSRNETVALTDYLKKLKREAKEDSRKIKKEIDGGITWSRMHEILMDVLK